MARQTATPRCAAQAQVMLNSGRVVGWLWLGGEGSVREPARAAAGRPAPDRPAAANSLEESVSGGSGDENPAHQCWSWVTVLQPRISAEATATSRASRCRSPAGTPLPPRRDDFRRSTDTLAALVRHQRHTPPAAPRQHRRADCDQPSSPRGISLGTLQPLTGHADVRQLTCGTGWLNCSCESLATVGTDARQSGHRLS